VSYERYIARRLFAETMQAKQVSRPAVRIAIIGIATGLAVMLLSVAIVLGFKHQVERNIIGLSSHIQVTSYNSNFSYEMSPMEFPDSLPDVLLSMPNIRHVQRFSTKPGVIKTGDNVQAVVFKGVSSDFDWDFLQTKMVRGTLPDFSGDTASTRILISETMSDRLLTDVGDTFISYFIRSDQITARKWTVCGIFNTHFSEYDEMFVLVDDRQLCRLNGWRPDQAGGLEVFVEDVRLVRETDAAIYGRLLKIGNLQGIAYNTQSVYDLNPDLFGWLGLLDTNVWLILVLMAFVSGFNMISGLLILILERTELIGMLKAMGAANGPVRKIFLHLASMLIGKGMAWGNLIGLGLCAIQYFFHVIPLDSAVYYVDSVPIEWNLAAIVAVNIGSMASSLLMMLFPTAIISRIRPVKAIRFD